jgi:hypothetical protein
MLDQILEILELAGGLISLDREAGGISYDLL